MKSRLLLLIVQLALLISGNAFSALGDDADESLADQAVAVKYQAARHKRDAYLAAATIKSADQTIKNGPARIEKEQKVLEKALEAQTVATADLAEKEAAVKAAQKLTEGSDDEKLKAAVATATRERDEAKRQSDRRKYDVGRAEGRVKSETDRVIKAEADKVAAEKAIPEKKLQKPRQSACTKY